MASFQAKIGCKGWRKRQNKHYRSVSFQPLGVIENLKKIAKKFEKLKNIIMASFKDKIGWNRSRMRENINYLSVPFRSNHIINTKFQKNSKKIKKISLWLHFKAK